MAERKRKLPDWMVLVTVIAVTLAAVYLLRTRKVSPELSLQGAVIRQDSDLRKETPIANVEISAASVFAASECKSDSSGFFRLVLPAGMAPGQRLTLLFRHPDYQAVALNAIADNRIYVAHMAPVSHDTAAPVQHPEVVISDVGVRYAVKATAIMSVGSVVKTFQVVNTGNVPCHAQTPCSPDHRWKASIGSISLDAGQDSEFQNVRVSCIAGPCPFTTIESRNFSNDGRTVKVSALDWSDTATFLLEAEVVRSMVSAVVREFYPVSFGEALNFTVPMGAERVYIEAELNGKPLVFPMGPDLLLDWADCSASVSRGQAKVFRCELKPGFRFK
jgi:hypothetical protein